MRIPTTAEFFTFFAATGQLSGFSSLPGVDSEFSLNAPPCDPGRLYKVKAGDICNSIAAHNSASTYQIMCENDPINGKCTNLGIGEEICLGRQGEDCRDIYVLQFPESAWSIAKQHNISPDVFGYNNYCHYHGSTMFCPPFTGGMAVCIAKQRIGNRPECPKIYEPES